MNLQEIRNKAADLQLHGIAKLRKGDLIRIIQKTEGNNPCFGAEWRQSCTEIDCCWREDCLK